MATKTDLYCDPKNEEICIRRIDGSSVEIPQPTAGKISIKLADCLGSDGNMHSIKLRELCVSVTTVTGGVSTTADMTVLVLCSEPYTLPS